MNPKVPVTRCSRSRQSGSVLVITLFFSVLLGITLGAYLYWVSTQNKLVAESQAWNAALALAEAGIEEGMAQINVGIGTANSTNFFSSAQNNFGGGGGAAYGPKTTTLTNGSYSVTISNDMPPSVYSTGTSRVPLIGKDVSRTVRVSTRFKPLFGPGMTALQNVNANSKNILVDSYDSSDPIHNSNGLYSSASPIPMAGGDVASVGGIINIGNATIRGHLLVSPGGSTTMNNALVGELTWVGPPNIEPGWIYDDYNQVIADVAPPYTNNYAPPTGTNGGYTLTTFDYYTNGNFSLKSQDTLDVWGNARLYVTGSFTMQGGNTSITIHPGASLRLYVGATSGSPTSADFTTVNVSGGATNFLVFGLPTTTSTTYSGNNATFIGGLYAPEAQFTLNGSGGTGVFMGACVVNSVFMNGNFEFHFDQALRNIPDGNGFSLAYWKEL